MGTHRHSRLGRRGPIAILDLIARAFAERHHFVPTEELPGGHCSRVFADDSRVLKIPWQGEELTSGCRAALKLAETGGPVVYAADEPTGMVLMERIRPGTTLAQAGLPDGAARRVALGFIARIQRLCPADALPLADYFDHLTPLRQRLLETTADPKFLHGDLHHFNILRGEKDWVVIDPKGLAGDLAYEPIAFMRNPMDWVATAPDLLEVTRFRAQWFAHALNVDPARIVAWGRADLDENMPTTDAWLPLIRVYDLLIEEFGFA